MSYSELLAQWLEDTYKVKLHVGREGCHYNGLEVSWSDSERRPAELYMRIFGTREVRGTYTLEQAKAKLAKRFAQIDKEWAELAREEERQEKRRAQELAFATELAAKHGMIYRGNHCFSWAGAAEDVGFVGRYHYGPDGFVKEITFAVDFSGMEITGLSLARLIKLYRSL